MAVPMFGVRAGIAMEALDFLVRERAHEGVHLVLVLPRVGGDLRDAERALLSYGDVS